MLRLLVALVLIAEGMTDNCSGRPRCHNTVPDSFPETEEELQQVCGAALEYLRCHTLFAQECSDVAPARIQMANRIIATIEEICSEDTLLHATVVENLECFQRAIYENGEMQLCSMNVSSGGLLQNVVTGLREEGLVSLPDNENDSEKLHDCVNMLNLFACHSVILERKCGAVGTETHIEIVRKVDPAPVLECDFSFNILPAAIRLYKLEEEKKNSIKQDLTD